MTPAQRSSPDYVAVPVWKDWRAEDRGPKGPWWQTADGIIGPLIRVSMDQGATWHAAAACTMPGWAG